MWNIIHISTTISSLYYTIYSLIFRREILIYLSFLDLDIFKGLNLIQFVFNHWIWLIKVL